VVPKNRPLKAESLTCPLSPFTCLPSGAGAVRTTLSTRLSEECHLRGAHSWHSWHPCVFTSASGLFIRNYANRLALLAALDPVACLPRAWRRRVRARNENGGGGNRTRVPKHFSRGLYVCIRRIRQLEARGRPADGSPGRRARLFLTRVSPGHRLKAGACGPACCLRRYPLAGVADRRAPSY